MASSDILIVGAGPTGLVLALWLAKQGVRVRIVDKTSEPGTTSRALAVQARTLELYRQLDLTDFVVERGHRVPAVNLWVKGERATRLPFETVGAGLTPYSFLQIFPQDEHERLLIARLEEAGVSVERKTELLGFEEVSDGVVARLRGPNGEESAEARFLAGCDGARSLIRETIKAGFPGGTYRQVFYVGDVEASGPALDGELHVDLDEADFLAVFPLAGEGRARLIGTVRDERADHADTLKFDDVSGRAIEHMKVKVGKVNWFSTYHVHHRVTEHFRHGRTFLLGDAAHIHSPVGGQGMNTGIGDAINLAWKLAAVIRDRAPDSLLDSYEIERIAFARRLVQTTDRIFTVVSAEGRVAEILRTRLAPFLLSRLIDLSYAREFLFRTVSQITLNYRGGPLSEGIAGYVHGGDRVPYVSAGGQDNLAPLAAIAWQVHVYGAPSGALRTWAKDRGIALHQFDWQLEHAEAGFATNTPYLIRPDTYVAAAGGSPNSFDRYFTARGIRP